MLKWAHALTRTLVYTQTTAFAWRSSDTWRWTSPSWQKARRLWEAISLSMSSLSSPSRPSTPYCRCRDTVGGTKPVRGIHCASKANLAWNCTSQSVRTWKGAARRLNNIVCRRLRPVSRACFLQPLWCLDWFMQLRCVSLCKRLEICLFVVLQHINLLCCRQAGIVGFITLQSKVRHPRWRLCCSIVVLPQAFLSCNVCISSIHCHYHGTSPYHSHEMRPTCEQSFLHNSCRVLWPPHTKTWIPSFLPKHSTKRATTNIHWHTTQPARAPITPSFQQTHNNVTLPGIQGPRPEHQSNNGLRAPTRTAGQPSAPAYDSDDDSMLKFIQNVWCTWSFISRSQSQSRLRNIYHSK